LVAMVVAGWGGCHHLLRVPLKLFFGGEP